jgi:ketosteroid isomerase-like protein
MKQGGNEGDDLLRQQVLDVSAAWARAICANDAQAIAAFMHDDWTIVGGNGPTMKADFLAQIAAGALTHEHMTAMAGATVRVYGATAVLTARVVNNGHFRGQPFSADEWTTDVFIRQSDAQWLCVQSHITPVRA